METVADYKEIVDEIKANVWPDNILLVVDAMIGQDAVKTAKAFHEKLNITGVLQRSHTPDDHAVFVDLKTAWVIEGLGHGHEDLAITRDSSVIMDRSANSITANAKLFQYTDAGSKALAKAGQALLRRASRLNRMPATFSTERSKFGLTAGSAAPSTAPWYIPS